MLKPNTLSCALVALGALTTNPAQAQLFDRGGGLIYDNTLNVTWLADANYAKTSGYDSDGYMSWQNAMTWASNLNYFDNVRNATYSDWRLPTITDLGEPGCNYGYSGTDCGYNVSTAGSELAHLYHGDFANKSLVDTRGQQQADYGLIDDPANPNDESLFSNIQSYYYWTGTSYNGTGGNAQDHAWYFRASTGEQYYHSKGTQFYAWAVRDGDVAAVPLPGAVWLFGSALIGMVFSTRRAVATALSA